MHGEPSTLVWNRACGVVAGTLTEAEVAEGDLMVARVLSLDGTVQSDGLVGAVEQDLAPAGAEALRWFDLPEVAAVVERAVARLATDGLSAAEAVEREDDHAYYALDVEGRVLEALRRRLAELPAAFAPLR